MSISNQQRFTDADGDEYEVKIATHSNRDFISILLNGIDEVVFRVEDAERIASMIVAVAKTDPAILAAGYRKPSAIETAEELTKTGVTICGPQSVGTSSAHKSHSPRWCCTLVTKQVIPAEAIEAAAKALAIQAWGQWEYVPNELRKAFIRDAKITLEAAAPYMFNGAADVVRDKGETNGPTVAMWLRAYGMQSASPIEPAPRLDSKLNPACPDGKWDDL